MGKSGFEVEIPALVACWFRQPAAALRRGSLRQRYPDLAGLGATGVPESAAASARDAFPETLARSIRLLTTTNAGQIITMRFITSRLLQPSMSAIAWLFAGSRRELGDSKPLF